MFDTLGNVLGTGASAIGSALNGTSNSQLMGLLGTLYSGDKAADATQKAAGQLSQGYTDQGNTIAKGAMDAANTAATGITQGAGTTAAGYNQSGTTAANGITQGANTTAGGITQGSNTMASGITQGADTTASGITQGAGTMASGITQGAGTIAGGYDKSTDIYHNQLDPYAAAGGPALAALEAGTAAGGQFNKPFTMADATNSEAERVARERGLDAIQNSAAYKGGLISSNDMQGLNKFAADTAAQYENQAFNQDLATKQNNYSNLNNLVGIGDNASRALASATGANAVGAGNAIGTGQINSAGVLGQGEINAAGVRGTAQTNAAGVQGKGQIESAGVLGKGQSDAAATLANSQLGAAKTTGAGQTNAAETMAKGQSGAATALGNAQASAAGANASGTMGAANAQTAMVDSAIKAYTALGGAKDAAGNPTNLAALQKALGQAGITIPQNVLSQGLTSVGDWLRNISNPTQASTSTNQTGGYQDPNLTNHLDPSVTPYPMYSDTAYAGDLRPNQPTFDISNQDTPTTTADLSMYDYGGSMN
jgi:hypothetical protein